MTSRPRNRALERYLRQINGTLFQPFGINERQEALREIAQHLRAMIETNLADGLSDEDATRIALEKFGDPDIIAQQLILERRRARRCEYRKQQGPVWIEALRRGWIFFGTCGANFAVPNLFHIALPWQLATWTGVVFGTGLGFLTAVQQYMAMPTTKRDRTGPPGAWAIVRSHLRREWYFYMCAVAAVDELLLFGNGLFLLVYTAMSAAFAYLSWTVGRRFLASRGKTTGAGR